MLPSLVRALLVRTALVAMPLASFSLIATPVASVPQQTTGASAPAPVVLVGHVTDAEFGMLLRDSPYKGKANFEQALSLAEAGRGTDKNGDRGEFISLVRAMQRISSEEKISENR